MIHGKPCHIRELTRRFLLMSDLEMEFVYVKIKDQPCVKEAYEQAKLIRSKKSK